MKNKVLVVEDNYVNRSILKKMLQDEYEVGEAENGAVALEIIKEEYKTLSAIILDLIMPVMDGRELLEILLHSEKYSNIPVLIATGEHDLDLERECLEIGAWDFVTKPYDPLILKLRLENIIGRSQTHLLQQIRVLAERDPLTHLYNRRFFMKKTSEMLELNRDKEFVLVRLDIDQFRLFNESFGSAEGDRMLQEIAAELNRRIAEQGIYPNTFGRIDADVFCLCIPYQKELLESEILEAERYMRKIRTDYCLKLSFGIYVIEENIIDMEQIYAKTVEASRICKNDWNKIFAYYGKGMGEKEQKAQRLVNEMQRALQEKHFKVYLQPKYSVQENMPCGAEALVRWIHPEWGMVSPGEFIPVFESNGLILQLDYYMWESVCELLRRWLDEGRKVYPVSVNISRVSMYNPQIVDQLVALTEKYGIDRKYLHLEITESAYMSNPDLMKTTIEGFRENGFVILMDDFGSGYSSLNTLKDIDVDILKIDMKFLPAGQNNVKSEKILVAIVRMAGWLGMPVVVEGVETLEQKEFLESIGCQYIQGYFYARPMPVPDYENLIEETNAKKHDLEAESENILKDNDAIWAASAGTAALLKSISVPFVIFEYADAHVDVLRFNQCYQKAIRASEPEKIMSPQEYEKLLKMLDDVALTQQNREAEYQLTLPDGTNNKYLIRLALMGKAGMTYLVSATFI